MRYCDLFCGCGGIASGFSQAGWKCVLAADNDAHALKIYRQNFSHPCVLHDLMFPLRDRHRLSRELAEGVVCGGPPCQDFSNCVRRGAKKKAGARAQLTICFGHRVIELLPRWVMFENVPNAANTQEFAALCVILREGGNSFEFRILYMPEFGMCQKRKRLVLLAHRGPQAAVRRAWQYVDSQKVSHAMTVREQFVAHGLPCPTRYYYYPSPSQEGQSIFHVNEVAPTMRARCRPMPETYQFVPADATHHPTDVFHLTPRHMAAIQHFPRAFQWLDGLVHNSRCIGNAVPPPLAKIIAQAITRAPPTPPQLPKRSTGTSKRTFY